MRFYVSPFTLALAGLLNLAPADPALAQMSKTQEKFQDLFATAGYGTAFGAAMGAATLPFQKHPERKLRSVAVGASIGFIAGSIVGGYMIFGQPSYAQQHSPAASKFVIQPIMSPNLKIEGIEGFMTLAEF